MTLTPIGLATFIGYFVMIVLFGLWKARGRKDTSEGYFLAGRTLPWYAIGLSMTGSNISTEHFIGMVGAAYFYGICAANWEWSNYIPYTLLIFIFLPYFYRSKLFTTPEFLENRYDGRTRSVFAGLTLIYSILVWLSGALYAGGKIINEMFLSQTALFANEPVWGLIVGVFLIAAATGIYCTVGGLLSAVWTEALQVVVMVIGGLAVTWLVLKNLGGLETVLDINRAADNMRLHLIQPADHEFAPWTGIASFWMHVSLWYVCTNQFYIQRALGGRTEWDARMGVVFAACMKIILPLIIVFPGILAFAAFGPGLDRDTVYLKLITDYLPTGLQGLLLAALAAAVMSTVSSVLNASSTIMTLDIYKRHIRQDASEHQLVKFGRWATAIIILIGAIWAPMIDQFGQGLFVYIQDLSAYFAPPIAMIFVVGLLWKRATAKAATWTLVLGILAGFGMQLAATLMNDGGNGLAMWMGSFLNRALASTFLCLLLLWLFSRWDTPPDADKVDGICWKPSDMALPAHESEDKPWYKNLVLWWAVMIIAHITMYVLFF
jgi:solute:Na+ symporter, SSS family